jgi:predicted nuclease of predicted toxin-antitoxin system
MNKVLLDENLPIKLKYRLQDVCEIYTVKDKGWNSLENGNLIAAMQQENFDYLITSDKNLQHQQNISKYALRFIVLNVSTNNYETILPLVEQIKEVLLNDIKVKLTIIPST